MTSSAPASFPIGYPMTGTRRGWSVSPPSDPDASVLILPITFEPFDRPRRQIVGSHFPR